MKFFHCSLGGLPSRQWKIAVVFLAVVCVAFTAEAAKEKKGRKRKQALEAMDNETESNNMEIGMIITTTTEVNQLQNSIIPSNL